jgi:hypothetical protein
MDALADELWRFVAAGRVPRAWPEGGHFTLQDVLARISTS